MSFDIWVKKELCKNTPMMKINTLKQHLDINVDSAFRINKLGSLIQNVCTTPLFRLTML